LGWATWFSVKKIILFIFGVDKIGIYKEEEEDINEEQNLQVPLNFKTNLISEEELEIIRVIFDTFFFSVLKIGDITPIEQSSTANDFNEQFKASDKYSYVVRFAKKYGKDYSEEEFVKLQELIKSYGFYFNEQELRNLILAERTGQEFLHFKETLLSYSPKTFEEHVTVFAKIFSKEFAFLEKYQKDVRREGITTLSDSDDDLGFWDEDRSAFTPLTIVNEQVMDISRKLHFLKKTMSENKVEVAHENGRKVSNEELIKMVTAVKRKNELERFEKSLKRNKLYSLEDVDLMSGYEFETFLGTLFEKMGYSVMQTKLSGDQGADLVMTKLDKTTVVQAKKSKNKVGNKAIQEVVASISHYKAQKGMVITNAEFTPSAIELAESNKVSLINKKSLERLIREYL